MINLSTVYSKIVMYVSTGKVIRNYRNTEQTFIYFERQNIYVAV